MAVTAIAFSALSVWPAGSPSGAAPVVERSALPAASVQSAEDEEHLRPLIEMVTADRRGRFYTLNRAEAATAERKHGFKRTDESAGITLFNEQVDGAIPVHRLRLRDRHQAYLLASNPGEIERLSDPSDSERQFDDEGVVGYVYKRSEADETMKLVRYNKNGDWRVARENRADLIAAGFRVDGPLGHVPNG